MRKTKGFSLMELMIALGVLTIIATVAVPKVQVWNARNRGLQTVMELISDFSKARSVAGYTVVGDDSVGKIDIPVNVSDTSTNATTMPVYLGVRLQTAMVFGTNEYSIYQKKTMKNDLTSWKTATMLKKNLIPKNVSIERVNDTEPQTDMFTRRLVFTSNGLVKNYNDEVLSIQASSYSCGGVNHHLTRLVAVVVLRSKIGDSGNDSIWYRVDIDQSGEYFICTAFSDSSSYDSSIFSSGNPLNL